MVPHLHKTFLVLYGFPQFIRKLERVLRLCLLWPTRTSSNTYSISLTSIEYYASIYSQVFQRGLFHLRFQYKMFRVFITIACVLYNQPSSSSLIWWPQIQKCKLWSSALRKSNVFSPQPYRNRCAGGQNWLGTTTFYLSNDMLYTVLIVRLWMPDWQRSEALCLVKYAVQRAKIRFRDAPVKNW